RVAIVHAPEEWPRKRSPADLAGARLAYCRGAEIGRGSEYRTAVRVAGSLARMVERRNHRWRRTFHSRRARQTTHGILAGGAESARGIFKDRKRLRGPCARCARIHPRAGSEDRPRTSDRLAERGAAQMLRAS